MSPRLHAGVSGRYAAARVAQEDLTATKPNLLRRRTVEGSLGILAGVLLACLNGPWLLSLLYTPPSGDSLSCGPTVNNALAYFVKLELILGLVGGTSFVVISFLVRRFWRKRRARATASS